MASLADAHCALTGNQGLSRYLDNLSEGRCLWHSRMPFMRNQVASQP
jgi:hypothetical protein